jgi:transcriptional regulator with XRE-family HTH domain
MLSENAANLVHRDSVTERLRNFMTAHSLSHGELARLLRIPPETLGEWLNGGSAPPGSLLALMIIFPVVPSEKRSPGVSRAASPLPGAHLGGRPSNTPEQEEALRRVRAI